MLTYRLVIGTALGLIGLSGLVGCSSGPDFPADHTPAGPGCVPSVFAAVRMHPVPEAELVVDRANPEQTHARGTIVLALENPNLPGWSIRSTTAGS